MNNNNAKTAVANDNLVTPACILLLEAMALYFILAAGAAYYHYAANQQYNPADLVNICRPLGSCD